MSWWRMIAVKLNADHTLSGSWPKIVCETLGPTCVAQQEHAWAAKVVGYCADRGFHNLQPTNNAEELGRLIHEQELLYPIKHGFAKLAGRGRLAVNGTKV